MTQSTLRMAVAPDPDGSATEVARAAGADVVPLEQAEALAWTVSDRDGFPDPLPAGVRWVQLPSAGVETWLADGLIDRDRTWSSAAGAYALPVAEHALLLLLAGLRQLPACVTATTWTKQALMPRLGTLQGASVGIIGAGGIARALIPMLSALGARSLAVNRSGREVPGAALTVPAEEADTVWRAADHVVIAAPATPDTRHLVGRHQLELMGGTGWLVNVARGPLVDTEALLAALDEGLLDGAALDVTDPEPLPDGHPLWTHPRAIVTPHIANPQVTLRSGFHRRLADNIERQLAGTPLLGLVDPDNGY